MEGLGTAEWIVIGLSVVIGLFFVIGNWYNNQRATQTLRWLRNGLSCWGSIQSIRMNAPSAVGITIRVEPEDLGLFSRLQGTLVLSRRENLPLWIFQILRGQVDTLELIANVRSANVPVIRAIHKTHVNRLKASQKEKLQALSAIKQSADYIFYAGDSSQGTLIDSLERLLGQYPGAVLSLSFQPGSPRLTILANLSKLLPRDPEALFRSLRAWIDACIQTEG